MPLATAQPIVDGQILAGLRELFDTESEAQTFVDALILRFHSSANETLAELRVAASRQDHQSISQLAHRLKGLSFNVGAMRLALLCGELEAGAARYALPQLEAACAGLAAELEAALLELRRGGHQN
jgi:HPt (histidine-containing phosphotransfer) domain-containing protein